MTPEAHPRAATARKPATTRAAPQAPARKPVKAALPPAPVATKKPARAEAPAQAAHPVEPAKAAKAVKPPKPAKAKPALVRDSFTMPEEDFQRIGQLKARALKAQRPAKKSELLRAGLHVLEGLSAAALVQVLNRLVSLKPGRPKKDR